LLSKGTPENKTFLEFAWLPCLDIANEENIARIVNAFQVLRKHTFAMRIFTQLNRLKIKSLLVAFG